MSPPRSSRHHVRSSRHHVITSGAPGVSPPRSSHISKAVLVVSASDGSAPSAFCVAGSVRSTVCSETAPQPSSKAGVHSPGLLEARMALMIRRPFTSAADGVNACVGLGLPSRCLTSRGGRQWVEERRWCPQATLGHAPLSARHHAAHASSRVITRHHASSRHHGSSRVITGHAIMHYHAADGAPARHQVLPYEGGGPGDERRRHRRARERVGAARLARGGRSDADPWRG